MPAPPSSTTWDEQWETLGNVQATQAVVSNVTYLQPTAPIKLGIIVELKDVATRETLRQVEGLWDAPRCHPPALVGVRDRLSRGVHGLLIIRGCTGKVGRWNQVGFVSHIGVTRQGQGSGTVSENPSRCALE